MGYSSYGYIDKPIIIGLMVLLIIWYHAELKEGVENFIGKDKVCNDDDHRCYSIVNDFKDKEEASEYLASINDFSIAVVDHMRKKYLWRTEGMQTHWEQFAPEYYTEMTNRLLQNYNPSALTENNPETTENTSFVEDKGRVFAVCLREKESGKHNFHDENLVKFVVLHELSHLASKGFGHGNEFWTNFKILLTNSTEIGYNPTNYKQNPATYCGLYLDENPYYINMPA